MPPGPGQYRERMLRMLGTMGRLLLAHWPALLAWFLFGQLGRHLAVEAAAYVGLYSGIGGLMLLALGVLFRLVALVAMLLVMRDGMAALQQVAPTPVDRRERRDFFIDALIAAMIPFIAFYVAAGYLEEDRLDWARRAGELYATDLGWGDSGADLSRIVEVEVSALTIVLIVVAFTGRTLWTRFRDRLPEWTAAVAVVFELVWTFCVGFIIQSFSAPVRDWVESRAATAWAEGVGDAIARAATPVAWAWEALWWLVTQLVEVVSLPLAWLAIAGVVYGVAISARGLELDHRVIRAARTRLSRLPASAQRRLNDLGGMAASRVAPIYGAIRLMLRGGPVLIGGFILLYSVTLLLEPVLLYAITRLVGPHDLATFWGVFDRLILLIMPLIVEPLRLALVASAYDATLDRVVLSAGQLETDERRGLALDRDVESEGAVDLTRDEEAQAE